MGLGQCKFFTPRRDPTSPYRRKRLLAFWAARLGFLRILRRSWRFLILRWGLSPLGWSRRSEGYHWSAFCAFWGTLDLHLELLGWPLPSILGVKGYPWTRSARRPFQGPPYLVTPAPFYAILEPKGVPKGSQNGAKIVKKSIQKSIEILVGFLSGFWTIFVQCWQCFWDPGPSKMSV